MDGTFTPPALQEVKAPSAKERKYDRQLRLWAASGQQALEEARLLLLNGGAAAVAAETLKNLVLPGLGNFTIVDPATVREEDLGVNFFLEEDSLGKSRAVESARLLAELNPDVKGTAVHEGVSEFLESVSLKDYSIILICGPLLNYDLNHLRSEAWRLSIPLVQVHCAGFYSSFSIQLPAQFPIVDTHPDPVSTQDLRLLAPWPELSAIAEIKTRDLEKMSDHDHGHIPYLLILLHFLEKWKASHGGSLPTAYTDKTAFRESVRAAARTSNPEGGEENFDEAVAAVLKSLNPPSIPSGLKSVFAERSCQVVLADSADFWYIANAIQQFVNEHGVLPLPGALPDMKAQSADYVALQNVYKDKARADVAKVSSTVRKLEASLRPDRPPIDAREIEAFCRGAAHVRLLHGRRLGDEHVPWPQVARVLEDVESQFPIQVAFQAMNAVLSLAPSTAQADAPAMIKLAVNDESAAVMESYVDHYLDRVVEYLVSEDEKSDGAQTVRLASKIRIMLHLQEMRRSGPAELHNIASLTGGMVAQEIIKVITRQYVPVDNTCVFDGITSKSSVFRL